MWVLILTTYYLSDVNSNTSQSTVAVPGFTTSQSCVIAAKAVSENTRINTSRSRDRINVSATCVKQ